MNDDRIARLTALKNELAEIKTPNYPNSYWSLINSWIAKATPIIRRDWNDFLGDFQKIAIEPNNPRVVYHNDFSISEQENRRQWKIDNLETDEVRQNILGFLNGLLTLPENRVSPKKKSTSKNKKTNSPVEVLIAKYGLFGTIAAAIIGVLGTCITAYFGFISVRAQVEAPILPTQTAESKSVFTPTPILIIVTGTPSPETIFTPTNTNEPVLLPTPDIHLGIESGCINKQFWTLYDGTGISADNNGCWKLSDWGFFAQDKVLYFLPPRNPDNQSHGLYTSLSGNVDINFNFRVEKIQTGTSQANIRFGIAPANIGSGKFLAYHFLPQYPDFLYPKLWQDGHYGDPFSISLNKGKTQKVTISIQDNFLTILLDNKKVVENMVLRFDERLFSIDYYLPSNGELSANISEFSIVKK